MNPFEQYRDNEISYQKANELMYLERNKLLHWATSYRGKTIRDTATQRAKYLYQAGAVNDLWFETYALMVQRTTPCPLQELGTGQKLHSIDGTEYRYQTPTGLGETEILHVKAVNPRERLARENLAYLRLDAIIEELEQRGFVR